MINVPCDQRACTGSALVLTQSPISTPRTPRLLSWCGHHYRSHGVILGALGWTILTDARDDLVTVETNRRRPR